MCIHNMNQIVGKKFIQTFKGHTLTENAFPTTTANRQYIGFQSAICHVSLFNDEKLYLHLIL